MAADLFRKLQTDSNFLAAIQRVSAKIAELEPMVAQYPHKQPELERAMLEMLRVCDYNAGLLVPYFFPRYPKTEPLSLFDRPYAFSMMEFQIGGFTVLRGSRQIGKSTTLVTRQKILSHIIPGFRSLYIAPHIEHVETYANRFREMERAFRYPIEDQRFRQNLSYKEFPNTSIIELVRILSNANDARGKTVDELVYDEYQHFDGSLEAEVQQTQKASKMPCTLYTGTSLTVDTALEGRWEQSSQGTWHMFCRCGFEIDCGDKESVLPIVQPEGPTCPRCSGILDVTNGYMVHAYEAQYNAGWKGYHVPQLIIPEYANNLRKWSEIYQAFCDYELATFLQEILGIPTEEGARELTKNDLVRMCCLPDSPSALLQKARNGFYKWVVSGCDWGGSDYIPSFQQKMSTTVHLMLGVRHDGDMDIVHMRRYGGMGYEEIAGQIAEDHKRNGGSAIATDFGVGAAYNMLLRKDPRIAADRHLIFCYTGPNSALLASPTEGWHNQYSLNRTESLTSTFNAIKRQRSTATTVDGVKTMTYGPNPRIRCYNYETASPLISDFLNLVRAPTESNLGVTSFKYRKHGSRPDDALHALNFAYALARIMGGEPLVEDRGLRDRLAVLLRTGATGGFSGSLVRPYSG